MWNSGLKRKESKHFVTFISDSKYDRMRGEYKGLCEVRTISSLRFVIYSLTKAGQSAIKSSAVLSNFWHILSLLIFAHFIRSLQRSPRLPVSVLAQTETPTVSLCTSEIYTLFSLMTRASVYGSLPHQFYSSTIPLWFPLLSLTYSSSLHNHSVPAEVSMLEKKTKLLMYTSRLYMSGVTGLVILTLGNK